MKVPLAKDITMVVAAAQTMMMLVHMEKYITMVVAADPKMITVLVIDITMVVAVALLLEVPVPMTDHMASVPQLKDIKMDVAVAITTIVARATDRNKNKQQFPKEKWFCA
ncbi:uncharacterized protein DMAD_09300 [Drosophila madeirensis]